MTFRMYVVSMAFATVLAWAGWLYVLLTADPYSAGILSFALFYATLATAMIGTFTLAGLVYRIIWRRHDVPGRQVRIAFRHAVVVSIVAISCLALSTQERLRWWVVGIFFLLASGLEFFFLVQDEARRR